MILNAYRKDKERLEQLQRYAEGLEEENVVLQKQLKLLRNVWEGLWDGLPLTKVPELGVLLWVTQIDKLREKDKE